MTDYVGIEFDLTPEDMAASVYASVRERYPDWQPNDANLEKMLTDAYTRLMAETAAMSSRVAYLIFQRFGMVIIGVPPILASPAQVLSTWTMPDNAGYTIEAETEVLIARTGDERYAFYVVNDVVVPPGSTATIAGAVLLRARIDGADANDIDSTTTPTLLTAVASLAGSAIDLVEDTHGGADAETETEYIGRLIEELRLMAPRPILPRDFEAFARRNSDVYRVLAVDTWDPDTDTLNNDRTIGLVAIESDGDDLNGTAKAAIIADLEARRETNFVVKFGSPTYTNIFVTATVRAYVGYDTAAVDADVTAAITAALSPQNRGVSPNEATTPGWVNDTKVRYKDIVTLIENVTGVNYIETLTIGTATAPAGTVDINLAGRVPLTRPAATGTAISVTVNAGP